MKTEEALAIADKVEAAYVPEPFAPVEKACVVLAAEVARLRSIIQEAIDKTTDRDTILDLERAL